MFSGYSATSSDFGSPKGRGAGPFSENSEGQNINKQISSTGSTKSIGRSKVHNFLDRNVYSISRHKHKVMKQAEQNYNYHMINLRESEFKPKHQNKQKN